MSLAIGACVCGGLIEVRTEPSGKKVCFGKVTSPKLYVCDCCGKAYGFTELMIEDIEIANASLEGLEEVQRADGRIGKSR